ncbi:uncharacterized protein LOC121643057 isoform X1 [Melanotaenia boesemani]|uniref:uncharacterized protein LOC121643057 isoform X1 n=1 Tax=Melanotaenia boesemani TaxID=1250792 RepID=UPI001C053F2E|nr:uncharacterized protein LOC121643057 isoform X1 [Melanotaenia boesemani]
MLIIFYALLMLSVGCRTDDRKFITNTVTVGQNATLTCPLQKSLLHQETYHWIRLVSGNWPEYLGGTFNFDFDGVTEITHITAKQENEAFVLHINGTKINDAGLYYCIKVKQLNLTFIKRTFLQIKGPEPDITAVIQEPPSEPLNPGDPVNLQCSVFFKTEKKTCPADHSVFWFKAGSDDRHPSFLYLHGNSGDKCERTPEANTTQKCVYSFSSEVTSSDAGTFYCAVATCGEILIGNGTKVDIQASNLWDLKVSNTVILLLGAALTVSLVVISVLVYKIKKATCGCWKDAVMNCDNQQIQQRSEVSLTYAAPTFTQKKACRAERKNMKTSQKETVYSDIRVLG